MPRTLPFFGAALAAVLAACATAPIPYKAPRFLGRDWKFREKVLNDPTPYDGELYEFDDATKKKFEAITKKLTVVLEKQKGDAERSGSD